MRRVPAIPHRGFFFRAIRFVYAADPLSAIGSTMHAGRYNVVGPNETLYLAERVDTTLYETRAVAPGAAPRRIEPTVLLTIDVTISKALDLRDPSILAALGLTQADLVVAWEAEMLARRVPITHVIAAAARALGFEAILAPSARLPGAYNLIIFIENLKVCSTIEITNNGGLTGPLRIDGRRR